MSLTEVLNWLTAQLNPYVIVAIFGGYFLAVGRMLYLTQRPPRVWDSPWERARKETEAEMEAELAADQESNARRGAPPETRPKSHDRMRH